MIQWMAGRLRCLSGKHERSEKHIERTAEADHFVSKCRYCGVPLKRRAKRDWIVISRAEYRSERQTA